jgi:hypothetical protein
MMDLHKKGLIHTTPDELEANTIHGQVAVRIVSREIPLRLRIRELGICRLWIENAGRDSWLSFLTQPQATGSLALVVFRNGSRIYKIPLKHDVGPGQRTHFTFELQAPRRPGRYTLQLSLMTISRWKRLTNSTPLLKETLEVEEDHT